MNPQLHDVLTVQEDYLIGGTPALELVNKDSDFYKPMGLLTGDFSPEQIIQKRMELKTVTGIALYHLLENPSFSLRLEELDPATHTTQKDPMVVEIKPDGSLDLKPELTESFYSNYLASFKAAGKPFEGRLREPSHQLKS